MDALSGAEAWSALNDPSAPLDAWEASLLPRLGSMEAPFLDDLPELPPPPDFDDDFPVPSTSPPLERDRATVEAASSASDGGGCGRAAAEAASSAAGGARPSPLDHALPPAPPSVSASASATGCAAPASPLSARRGSPAWSGSSPQASAQASAYGSAQGSAQGSPDGSPRHSLSDAPRGADGATAEAPAGPAAGYRGGVGALPPARPGGAHLPLPGAAPPPAGPGGAHLPLPGAAPPPAGSAASSQPAPVSGSARPSPFPEESEERRRVRMARNRENAHLSRQRKKAQLATLESTCAALARQSGVLEALVVRLCVENERLRAALPPAALAAAPPPAASLMPAACAPGAAPAPPRLAVAPALLPELAAAGAAALAGVASNVPGVLSASASSGAVGPSLVGAAGVAGLGGAAGAGAGSTAPGAPAPLGGAVPGAPAPLVAPPFAFPGALVAPSSAAGSTAASSALPGGLAGTFPEAIPVTSSTALSATGVPPPSLPPFSTSLSSFPLPSAPFSSFPLSSAPLSAPTPSVSAAFCAPVPPAGAPPSPFPPAPCALSAHLPSLVPPSVSSGVLPPGNSASPPLSAETPGAPSCGDRPDATSLSTGAGPAPLPAAPPVPRGRKRARRTAAATAGLAAVALVALVAFAGTGGAGGGGGDTHGGSTALAVRGAGSGDIGALSTGIASLPYSAARVPARTLAAVRDGGEDAAGGGVGGGDGGHFGPGLGAGLGGAWRALSGRAVGAPTSSSSSSSSPGGSRSALGSDPSNGSSSPPRGSSSSPSAAYLSELAPLALALPPDGSCPLEPTVEASAAFPRLAGSLLETAPSLRGCVGGCRKVLDLDADRVPKASLQSKRALEKFLLNAVGLRGRGGAGRTPLAGRGAKDGLGGDPEGRALLRATLPTLPEASIPEPALSSFSLPSLPSLRLEGAGDSGDPEFGIGDDPDWDRVLDHLLAPDEGEEREDAGAYGSRGGGGDVVLGDTAGQEVGDGDDRFAAVGADPRTHDPERAPRSVAAQRGLDRAPRSAAAADPASPPLGSSLANVTPPLDPSRPLAHATPPEPVVGLARLVTGNLTLGGEAPEQTDVVLLLHPQKRLVAYECSPPTLDASRRRADDPAAERAKAWGLF